MPERESIVPQDLFGQEVNPDNLIKMFKSEAKRIFIAMTEKMGEDDLPDIQEAIDSFIARQIADNAFSERVYSYVPNTPAVEVYRGHLRDVLLNIENLAISMVVMDRTGAYDDDAGRAYIVGTLSVARFQSGPVDLGIVNPLIES